jgi:hypothetical protein
MCLIGGIIVHENAFNETVYEVPTTKTDSSLLYLNRILC